MVFLLLKKKNVRPASSFLTKEEAFKIQGIIDWKDYSSKEKAFKGYFWNGLQFSASQNGGNVF